MSDGGFIENQSVYVGFSHPAASVSSVPTTGHFKTLVRALEAAGLAETLKGKGPFTVFAPFGEAFARLPSGTLDNLLKPENKEKLKAVLLMHVVPGNLLIADMKKVKDATTSGGAKVEVTHHLLTGVHIGTAKDMAHVENSDIHGVRRRGGSPGERESREGRLKMARHHHRLRQGHRWDRWCRMSRHLPARPRRAA